MPFQIPQYIAAIEKGIRIIGLERERTIETG
jgi:hypothetical protein